MTRWLLPQVTGCEKNPHHAELTLFMADDIFYFDGHFPGHPIVPGVTQIHWAIHFVRELFGLALPFAGMRQIKFQKPILPGMRVTLTLDVTEDASKASFAYFTDDARFSSGRLSFATEKA